MDNAISPPEWIREQWSQDPHESDVLFPTLEELKNIPEEEHGPRWANAGLHIKDPADSYAYAAGYRRGAQVLAEYAVGRRYETNVLVYPILYLYRHTIELHLKRIIPVSAKLVDSPLNPQERNLLFGRRVTHSLDDLWSMFEPRLKYMRENKQCEMSEEQVRGIASYIRQLSEVDEASVCFRYASSKDGSPHLQNLNHINIVRITQVLERLASCLQGFDEMIHEQYDAKCEWLWEAQEEAALPPSHTKAFHTSTAFQNLEIQGVKLPRTQDGDLGLIVNPGRG